MAAKPKTDVLVIRIPRSLVVRYRAVAKPVDPAIDAYSHTQAAKAVQGLAADLLDSFIGELEGAEVEADAEAMVDDNADIE